MTDFAPKRNLTIGEVFTQDEVDSLFEANFGFQFKGITYRNPDRGKYIILMENEGNVYHDEIGPGSEFVYEGEGEPKKGDQILTGANRALKEAVTELIPVYFFRSEDGIDQYEYRGLVDVLDCRYVSDGERMVYKYEMRKFDIATWEEVRNLVGEIVDETEELELEEDTAYTQQKVLARSSIFSREVKKEYGDTCAACGSSRFSPEGLPEVEAAHIYPKSENGPDRIQNGLALCRLHHWAFDAGWFSISDDFQVIVNDGEEIDPPEEIESIRGEPLRLPEDSTVEPDPKFLEAHRGLHGIKKRS